MSENITLSPQRTIGGIVIDCTIEETGTDTLTITEHPVEQGAAISDHAYRNPAQLVLRAGWSNSSAQGGGSESYAVDTYARLLALQANRTLIDVVTGKRSYQNMLIQSLAQTTDEKTEAILSVTITLKEVILVSTQTTTLPPASVQASPQQTAEPVSQGTVQAIPTGVTPAAANG